MRHHDPTTRPDPQTSAHFPSRAYRPDPGPRQGWWSTIGLGAVLGGALMGLVAGPSGFGHAASDEEICRAERELWPEAAPELRIQRRALSFDHMFRADSGDKLTFGS